MTVRQRYLLIQLPGWVLAVIVLYALWRWAGLPVWGAILLWLAFVVKDLARRAYEPSPATGPERLVGAEGRAAPNGYVHVRGELWRAAPEPGSPPLTEGAEVRVVGARGMLLIVRREEPEFSR
jgi:membrane protein implicated in regulation of membrane protease activity